MHTVGLDFGQREKLLVELLKVVGVRASKIVRFAHGLLSFNGVENSQSHIVGEYRLDLGIHAFDNEVHSVEHFHLNTPLGSDVSVWVDVVHHHGWSQDSHVWECLFDLLLTNPLGPQSHALGVWIGSSGRDVDEPLHIWVSSRDSSDGPWDINVSILELLLLLVVDMGANARNNSVLVSDNVLDVVLIGHVSQLDVSFIS